MQTKQLFKRYSLQLAEETSESYKSMEIKNIKISSGAMVKVVNDIFQLDKKPEEHMILLCLNNNNFINAVFEVSHGTVSATDGCIANVLKRALLVNANKIIICHNHPGGSVKPSRNDYQFTDELYDASQILGITLLDHIIVTQGKYKSLLQRKECVA